VAARYDGERDRIVVELSTGAEVAFPPHDAQGLEAAKPEDLAEIAIDPPGFGLHFPRLDADLYLPALLQGLLGSKAWAASRMGQAAGRKRWPSFRVRSGCLARSSPIPGGPTPCAERARGSSGAERAADPGAELEGDVGFGAGAQRMPQPEALLFFGSRS
jgi:hypothetical protein